MLSSELGFNISRKSLTTSNLTELGLLGLRNREPLASERLLGLRNRASASNSIEQSMPINYISTHNFSIMKNSNNNILDIQLSLKPFSPVEKLETTFFINPEASTATSTAEPGAGDTSSSDPRCEPAADKTQNPKQKIRYRQVTFSKRKSSLLRKAQQLSVLCNAEVRLVIFSPSGRLFHYTSSSFDSMLEKHISSQRRNDRGHDIEELEKQLEVHEKQEQELKGVFASKSK